MLPQQKRNTNIGVGIGIALQIGSSAMKAPEQATISLVLLVLGAIFFIWGCSEYCKGKGYSSALGFLGLFSILGLIVLAVLPDKHKEVSATP